MIPSFLRGNGTNAGSAVQAHAALNGRSIAAEALDLKPLRSQFLAEFRKGVLNRMRTTNLRSRERAGIIDAEYQLFKRPELLLAMSRPELEKHLATVRALADLRSVMESRSRGKRPRFMSLDDFRKRNPGCTEKDYYLSTASITNDELQRKRIHASCLFPDDALHRVASRGRGLPGTGNAIAGVAKANVLAGSIKRCASFVTQSIVGGLKAVGVNLNRDNISADAQWVPDRLDKCGAFQKLYQKIPVPSGALGSIAATVRFLDQLPEGSLVFYQKPGQPGHPGHAQVITGRGEACSDYRHGLYIYAHKTPRMWVYVPRDRLIS